MTTTQAQVDEVMHDLGCEVREYGGDRNPGGLMCTTHYEVWWYANGVKGCKRAILESGAA